MSISLDDPVLVTIEDEVETKSTVEKNTEAFLSVKSAMEKYQHLQSVEATSTDEIAKLIDIVDIDDIDKTIALSIKQINDTTTTHQEKEKTTTSKAMTILSKTPFLGKYLDSTTDTLEMTSIESRNVNDTVSDLRDGMVRKKEELISFITKLNEEKLKLQAQIPQYEELKAYSENMMKSAEQATQDYWDATELNSFAIYNISSINEYIRQEVNPLTDAATKVSSKILKILPTLNNQLKRKLTVKGAQDILKNLNTALNATIELNEKITTQVTADVRATQLEVMESLGKGANVQALEDNAKKQILHMKKLNEAEMTIKKNIEEENRALNNINDTIAVEYAKVERLALEK